MVTECLPGRETLFYPLAVPVTARTQIAGSTLSDSYALSGPGDATLAVVEASVDALVFPVVINAVNPSGLIADR